MTVSSIEFTRSEAPESASRWLSNTPLLQHDHPRIRLLAIRLTQLKASLPDKALACYRYMRKLPFGCSADPANMSSIEVLAAKMGDANTKSTLFIALLRSLDIPARVRVVMLKPGHLTGIMNTGGRSVEHAFTEVWIDRGWQGVDSYVVDLPLGLAARKRLLGEHLHAGYGVHFKGQVAWDATCSSFGQFSSQDPESVPVHDFGPFDDIRNFHQAAGRDAHPGWAQKKQWAIAAALANRRIRKLRDESAQAPGHRSMCPASAAATQPLTLARPVTKPRSSMQAPYP